MRTVGEIMTCRVLSVRPDVPIERVILLFVDERIHGVPVLDEDRRPIGFVSKSDLVFDHYEWAELRDEACWFKRVANLPQGVVPEGDLFLEELLRSKTVSDIMSPEPFTVEESMPIEQFAQIMAERRIHSCPVVNAEGIVVGMVSASDVMKWVGRTFCASDSTDYHHRPQANMNEAVGDASQKHA